ncbi:hypothetical protein [Halalkalibacterium ligniniphilum]|uniref:hypothetical protein n=1 Tax=Halalkalibacterium ligniniphilum TaxID=1134413 RepID=UPI00034AB2AA|nr:hypothetical protein [Halalkalibacterium ligniniphilum]
MKRYVPILMVSLASLFLGFLSGLSLDKTWLSNELYGHIYELETENEQLQLEQQGWVTYVNEELASYELFLDTNHQQWLPLAVMLKRAGLEVKPLLTTTDPFEKKGILITLGEEKNTSHMLTLSLDEIPKASKDFQELYVSLLKMKKGDSGE